jgi:hypothetical protein
MVEVMAIRKYIIKWIFVMAAILDEQWQCWTVSRGSQPEFIPVKFVKKTVGSH